MGDIITKAFIAENHPEVFDAIKKEGIDETKKTFEPLVSSAKEEGAKAERERIQDVEQYQTPGFETMIKELKFDGKTTGPEAAAKVLVEHNKRVEKQAAALKADAPDPVDADEAPQAQEEPKKVFLELVAEYQNAHNCKRSQAIRAITVSNPDAHQQFINDSQ